MKYKTTTAVFISRLNRYLVTGAVLDGEELNKKELDFLLEKESIVPLEEPKAEPKKRGPRAKK